MNESLLSADQTDEIDPTKNYYDELVGPDKKFKDNEALAKKAVYADQHISRVEKENAELQQAYLRVMEESNTKAKLAELIDQYDKRQQQMSITQPEEKTEQKPYDPTEIESLVSRKLQEHEMSRKQQDNYNKVKDRLIERFGPQYQTKVKQQIESLGINETLFNDMARNHPQLVYKTLDLDQPVRQEVTIPRNSPGYQTQTPDKKRTWSYYKPLFKKNPTDRNLLIQMDKDSQELGDAFFDD